MSRRKRFEPIDNLNLDTINNELAELPLRMRSPFEHLSMEQLISRQQYLQMKKLEILNEEELNERLGIGRDLERFIFNNSETQDLNKETISILKKLNNLYKQSNEDDYKLKSYLLFVIINIITTIYSLIIKFNLLNNSIEYKKIASNISWLIFKLMILLLRITLFFISTFSQSTIGWFIIFLTFCSFYSTDVGYACTNSFLDVLSIVAPNKGSQTIKETLINIGYTKTRALQLFIGVKEATNQIGNINEVVVNLNETFTNAIGTVGDYATSIGNQLEMFNETIGDVKKQVLVGLAAVSAQQVSQNVFNTETMNKILNQFEILTNQMIDLKNENTELRDKLDQITDTLENNAISFERQGNLITNEISGLRNQIQITHESLTSSLQHIMTDTQSIPQLIPEIENLFLINQENQGELLNIIIKGIEEIKNDRTNNLQDYITDAMIKQGIAGFSMSKDFLKVLSDVTGIGLGKMLNQGTRERIGIGGRKKTRKNIKNKNNKIDKKNKKNKTKRRYKTHKKYKKQKRIIKKSRK